MLNTLPVFWGLGLLLSLFAPSLALPAFADALAGQSDWRIFAATGGACLFAGQVLVLANRHHRVQQFSVRQVVLLALFGWLTLSVAGALPFIFGSAKLDGTDAWFEAMSGLTTTGSTVMRHLDRAAPGILLWRALLQWMGGIGVLLLASAVLPGLKIGGMQLFRKETSRTDETPMLRRAVRLMGGVLAVYAGLTLIVGLLLRLAGMRWFDAVLHALSTLSCGGFSTSDGSIGHWRNPGVDWVILLGMLLGGMPFALHWQVARGQWRQVAKASQLRWFLGLILFSSSTISLWLVIAERAKPLPALRHSLFAVTSVMTGTGFATLDWSRWTGFPLGMLFLLTFIGGCAGSAAGGIKVFRLQILLANARIQLHRLLSPHAVLVAEFDGKPVPETVAESVLGFLFVYVLSFALLAMTLSLFGLDFAQALGASASALANLGPGIDPSIGPMAGFGGLPDPAKWVLSLGMLMGRLEFFVVFAVFSRGFWED